MRLTIPQLRLISEGELYGHYVKDGRGSIDQLINLVQDHFIDWDVQNEKFKEFFYKTHPKHMKGMDEYLRNMGLTMPQVIESILLAELPDANQSQELIDKLIRKTESQKQSAGKGILGARLEHILHEYSGGLEAFIIDGLKLDTIGKVVRVDKSRIADYILKLNSQDGDAIISELASGINDYVRNGPFSPSYPSSHFMHLNMGDKLDILKWVKS